MRKTVVVALVAAGLSVGVAQAADAIKVPQSVPFSEDAEIAGKIKNECHINQQLGEFIAEYAKENHLETESMEKTDDSMPGRVLVVEIRDAISEGNPFIGHHKSTSVRGALYQDGAKIGSFKGRRNSMGGAFAGYKGSCSVLGRTVKALGKDIAEWMVSPSENAQLGDLK